MRIAIVRFPGSNCDRDCMWAFGDVLGYPTEFVWHLERQLPAGIDLVVLPGGFAYGDYLRAGAIARSSPIMGAVEKWAQDGGLVLGICNGFQLLTEARLLPGTLAMNHGLKFVSQEVYVRIENAADPWTSGLGRGTILRLPIAHQEGAYIASRDTLRELNENSQILMRYVSATGAEDATSNPNGSAEAIAGIVSREGNVFGLMPHPERAMEDLESFMSLASLPPGDGRRLLECIFRRQEVGA